MKNKNLIIGIVVFVIIVIIIVAYFVMQKKATDIAASSITAANVNTPTTASNTNWKVWVPTILSGGFNQLVTKISGK